MKVTTMFKKDLAKKKKKRSPTDEPYLNFIRSQPCLICGQKSVAHHEPIGKTSGMAMKGSDNETIPFCNEHHVERHQIGKLTFYEKYDIDYVKEIERLQEQFKRR